MRLVPADAQIPLSGGKLRSVVDAIEATVVLEGDRADEPAVLAGKPDELREVDLAGRGRGLQRGDPPAKPVGVEGVQPGVDLVPFQLVVGGVLRLDDPLDRPEVAADDPPEVLRIRGEDRGEGDG